MNSIISITSFYFFLGGVWGVGEWGGVFANSLDEQNQSVTWKCHFLTTVHEAFDSGPVKVYGKLFIGFSLTGIGTKNEITDHFR